MAELVQLNLEKTLPELEFMERLGLFSGDEIKMLIKRRKAFEYRIRKRVRQKDDFLKYIEFEVNLLALIKKRRKRLMCNFKRREIDHSIANRVNKLFQMVGTYFKGDIDIGLNHIAFCKKMNWFYSVSTLFVKMLKVHSLSPQLWVMAAKWEIDGNNSYENARGLMQRGLRFNPSSDLLWREYFKLELMYTDLMHKRQQCLGATEVQSEGDAVLSGDIALVVYDNATKEINDVNFALSFIQICQEFEFTAKHIDHIFNHVLREYSDREEALDAVAKRDLINMKEEIKLAHENGLKKKTVFKKKLETVCVQYEEAVQHISSEKMWGYYISFLQNQMQLSKKENRKKQICARLMDVMGRAAKAECLSLDLHLQWAKMLEASGARDECLSVSVQAARRWNRGDAWQQCLRLHIRNESKDGVICELFGEAITALAAEESLPVWKLGLEWLSLSDPSKLMELFENAIGSCPDPSLKEMYLDAVALHQNIRATRELYARLKKLQPLSLSFFKKMIDIENAQLKPSLKSLRRCFEDAVREYGSTSVDVWLDFMKMEHENPKSDSDSYGMLYWRAMKMLEPELTSEFVTEVTLYATGHSLSTHWMQNTL